MERRDGSKETAALAGFYPILGLIVLIDLIVLIGLIVLIDLVWAIGYTLWPRRQPSQV